MRLEKYDQEPLDLQSSGSSKETERQRQSGCEIERRTFAKICHADLSIGNSPEYTIWESEDEGSDRYNEESPGRMR